MNLNEVDWESLEKHWRRLFRNTSKIDRYLHQNFLITSEELLIVIYAYEKFEGLIVR